MLQPKIVLLSPDVDEKHGPGRITRKFCGTLFEKGIAFELHLSRTATRERDLPYSSFIRYDLPPRFLGFGKRWYRVIDLWWMTRTLSIDGHLIHSLVEFPYGLLARWLACRHSLPFGFTAHGTYAVEPFDRWFDRLWFRRMVQEADFIGAVSEYTRRRLCQNGGTEQRITVIHNGVDVNRFPYGSTEDRQQARQALEIEPQARVILCVGALKARKGTDVLLRAFSLIRQTESRARLLFVGPGPAGPYQRLAAELGIENAVRFLGVVDHKRLVRCYHACDVFALLPREDPQSNSFEGFGMVYLEANACGRPVVGTRSGGVPDAVRDGHTGLLVEPEVPEAAARAILRLLCDPELARRLGDQGRAWAEEHTWDRVVEAYLQVYQSVAWERKL